MIELAVFVVGIVGYYYWFGCSDSSVGYLEYLLLGVGFVGWYVGDFGVEIG